ncbi:MAG TPA: sulfite exporter TauE/SafE family protein [Pyrinomonadaceae bacterium]|nr:sulfite exporter TauE/SafE family protein [Pyrinomonadaceae bacterium]
MSLSISTITLLIIIFFITAAVGVVTGSNSLITVPIMFQFGIEPKVAVATNMFGLTFMSIGATIPFLKADIYDRKTLTPLVILTLIGSALGAILVGLITNQSIKIIVSVSMIFVALFTLFRRNAGLEKVENVSQGAKTLVFILTLLLGIYGGLFSGGYVTILTAVYVAFFGMTFTEAVASTKLINVFSSLIASAIFAWQGLIDYKIGLILAVTMFIAAYVGAHTVTKLNDLWLKRIFLSTVLILAIKTIYDYL